VHFSGENDSFQQMASSSIPCLVGKYHVYMSEGLPVLQRDIACATCHLMRRINLYLTILVISLVIVGEPGALQGTDCRKASRRNCLASGKFSYGLDQIRIMFESHHQIPAGIELKNSHRLLTILHSFYPSKRQLL